MPRRVYVRLVGRLVAKLLTEALQQGVDPLHLGVEDLAPRLVGVEPLGPIDLREVTLATAARRPLEPEGVAPQRRRIELPLRRPGLDHLAGLLADRAEVDHPLDRQCRCRDTELLPHLAQRADPG